MSKLTGRHTEEIPSFFHVSEAIKIILTPLNIRTAYKQHNPFRETIKDSVKESKRSGIWYSIRDRICENRPNRRRT